MNAAWTGSLITLCALLWGCTPPSLFQSDVMKDVETNFDFQAWRLSPNTQVGRSVQLGGRILQAKVTNDGVIIIAMQLPIVEHPVYGPYDTGKRTGEFAFLYQGKLEMTALTPGNRLVVVGTTERSQVISVDDVSKTQPYVIARCVHIWKTEGRQISDFPNLNAGYYPLEENTYCARPPRRNF